jgi:hypothetical protein
MKYLLATTTLSIALYGTTAQADKPLDFTGGISFDAGVLSMDGGERAAIQSVFADYQINPPSTYFASINLASAHGVMLGPIQDWVFIGLADLLATQVGTNFDYNSLIYGTIGVESKLPKKEP